MKLFLGIGAAAALVGGAGCVNSDTTTPAPVDRGPFALPCDDGIDDVYRASADDTEAAIAANSRGAIVTGASCQGAGSCSKCGPDTSLNLAQIAGVLQDDGYQGPASEHTLDTYRFAYRTERLAGGKVRQGTSTARILAPSTLLAPSSKVESHTLVVVVHDTTGFGAQCASSLADLRSANGDDQALALALASHGYLTVAPDLAGGAGGDPPPGWQLAEDEAHAVLDATRAMKNLLPERLAPQRVVLVGLGEGGHAVLAAQAMASGYGLAGELVGAIAFAPIWVAPRTWGAALQGAGALNTADDAAEIALDLLYFYGHGELYDGRLGGVAMLRDEKRSAARGLIEERCFDDLVASVGSLGDVAKDIFDPTFVHDVSSCAVAGKGASCHRGAAKTWNPRFSADRPAVDPAGAPIVVWQGGADSLVPPDRAICGKDALEKDLAKHPSTLTYCGDDKATHGSVVERDVGWVIAWIDHETAGGAAPKACPAFAPTDDDGNAVTCIDVPPNGE